MMNISPFGLYEYIGFALVIFILGVLDAILTNIIARVIPGQYHRVEYLSWVKWIYFRTRKYSFALAMHLMLNLLFLIIMILLPVKAGYLLVFVGFYLARVWNIGYKAYIYGRGYI